MTRTTSLQPQLLQRLLLWAVWASQSFDSVAHAVASNAQDWAFGLEQRQLEKSFSSGNMKHADSALLSMPFTRPRDNIEAAVDRHQRQVQESTSGDMDFVYQADYLAQFSVFRDATCQDFSPVIRLFCSGPNIALGEVSSPTINCTEPIVDEDGTTGSLIECINTCASVTECQDVYLAIDSIDAIANISFSCGSNDNVTHVEGLVWFDEGTGFCTADAFMFPLLRLGVSCPTSSDNAQEQRDYIFDDFYFECRGRGGAIALSGFGATDDAGLTAPRPGDLYACVSGTSCSNGTSCDIVIEPFFLFADLPNLYESSCIQSTMAIEPPPPNVLSTLTNATSQDSPVIITTRFFAAWGLLFEPTSSCRGTANPTVTITCGGNADIKLVNATSSVSCETSATSNQVLQCTSNNTLNKLGLAATVHYSCTGFELTDAKLEYPEGTAACNGNSAESVVSQAVQMGVICASTEESAIGPAGTEFTYYGDLVFDCTDLDALYNDLDEYGVGFTGDDSFFATMTTRKRYTCYKATQFAAGSTPDAVQPIPAVGISTDTLWLTFPDEACFTTMPNPDYTGPSIVPSTIVPTLGATTAFPTLGPTTQFPTPVPSTVLPTASPTTLVPAVPEPTPIPTADLTSSPQLAVSSSSTTAAPMSSAAAPVNAGLSLPAPAARPIDAITDRSGNESSDSSSSSSNNLAIGAGVGGGGVAVALAVLAAFLVGKKRQSNGSGNNDDVNSTKSPAGITIHTGGTTSLDQYPPSSQQAPPSQPHAVYQTGNQYRPYGDATEASETETGEMPVIVDGTARPNLYEDTSLINQYDSSLSNATPTPYYSAATPPPPQPPVMRMSASDVEYKDQVRSVAAMPIVQPMPDDDDIDQDEPMMVAPVMGPAVATLENSVVSAKTQASYGSNDSSSSYPRRPIDP